MKRYAVIIGNQEYKYSRTLVTPINDFLNVRKKLQSIGFEVLGKADCSKTDMRQLLMEFNEIIELNKAEVALLYFSGHACQIDGENWLLAVDSKISERFLSDDLMNETTLLSKQIMAMRACVKVSLVFLDACRNNPFSQVPVREPTRTRSVQPVSLGLRRIRQPQNSVGQSLIAFATEAGQLAEDGEELSPFTRAFVEHVDTPGLEIRQLLQRIKNAVALDTGGQQSPSEETSLRQDFYFVPPPKPEDPGKIDIVPTQIPADGNDLVVLFGGVQAGTQDVAVFRSLTEALTEAPPTQVATIGPWRKGSPVPPWDPELESKLLAAKRPLFIDYRSSADRVKEDSRVRHYLYASAAALSDMETDYYARSDNMLRIIGASERLIWMPSAALVEDFRELSHVKSDPVAQFAPAILRRLGIGRDADGNWPRVAADTDPLLGANLMRMLGQIVGVEKEPAWSTAVRQISFKRSAGGDDRLLKQIADEFPERQANVVAACEPRNNASLTTFLDGIDSRIVEGQRQALISRRLEVQPCVVKFVVRINQDDDRDTITGTRAETDDSWFVLRLMKTPEGKLVLANLDEAQDWLIKMAMKYSIDVPRKDP